MATSMSVPPVPASPPPTPALWLLVLVTLTGTMAMHMFVPALPDAAASLGTGAGPMQMTIGIYVIGLGVGQLFYGPLSDAYGRRPLLMTGLGLYALGGLVAALAPNLATLLGARLLQAPGGCAGVALGRAIVRDTQPPSNAVRQMALMNLMVLVSPGLAPVVGGALAGAWGWRAVFVMLAAIGAVTLWFARRRLPETAQPSGKFGIATLRRDYGALFRMRRFMGYSLGGAGATTSFFAFVAAAPFIYTTELHQPPALVGVYMGLMAFGMATGNYLTSRLIRSVSAERLLRTGNLISLGSAATLLAVIALGQLSVPATLLAMLGYTAGAGMTSPAAMAKAIEVDRPLIGAAAGLYGFIQMAVGAVCTTVAAMGSDPAMSAVSVLVGASLLSFFSFRVAVRAPA
ncbi:Bcr/CflA family efflux MFS transporter [Ramlibacter terrae]|uniref:Bcr/CflA family efflux transporter n=1 Tax=Ramlibacter terrae TaxID=2732511 RepID=A0ABX6P217_9BURK|nr:Bcr/CflA family efflux MFS transporter [Ramlibacter terrae]